MSCRLSHDAVAWDVNRDFRLLSASLYHAAKSTDPLSPFVSLWSAGLDVFFTDMHPTGCSISPKSVVFVQQHSAKLLYAP